MKVEIKVDPTEHYSEMGVALNPTNFEVAGCLMIHGGGSFKENVEVNYVYGPSFDDATNYIDTITGEFNFPNDPTLHPLCKVTRAPDQVGYVYPHDLIVVTDSEGKYWWGRVD